MLSFVLRKSVLVVHINILCLILIFQPCGIWNTPQPLCLAELGAAGADLTSEALPGGLKRNVVTPLSLATDKVVLLIACNLTHVFIDRLYS